MAFDNPLGYTLSVSMENFITIFHSVQEMGPFSLSQNLGLRINIILQSLRLDLVNINEYADVYKKKKIIKKNKKNPNGLRVMNIFR